MKKKMAYTGQDYFKLVLLACLLFTFFVFLVMPLLMLFGKAFFDQSGTFVWFDQFITYFRSSNMLRSLCNTIEIAFISTFISVGTAFFFSFCLSRKDISFKRELKTSAMLPMFAPSMLFGMSLIYLLGNKGVLTQIGLQIPVYGKIGIVIAEAIYCFPIALMIIEVAFSAADNRLYEAADTLGASALRKMMTVTLPSVKYGLINAFFICFTYSFTDFGAPSVVGGNFNVLATDIYKQVIGQQNFNMGAVVGIFMMITTVISFIVNRVTSAKQTSAISSKSIPYKIKPHKFSDRIATLFCCIVSLTIVSFFLISLYGSLVSSWPYNLKLTLEHYDFTKIAAGTGLDALKQSIKVSCLVAVFGSLIAFITAYLIEKITVFPKIRKLLYFLSIAPTAIPGTVIGLSFILFFNPKSFAIPYTDWSIINSFNVLYGTTLILIVVNIVHYFSVPFVTASTSLKRLDSEFESVSDSLSVPFYKTFLKITLPMSVSALMEMATYYFMNSMITVSAVIFLYTPVTKLASIVILNINDAGDDAQAAALCMMIVMINMVVRFIYDIVHKRVMQKHQAWMVR